MDTHYEGRAFAYDDNPSLPGTCAFIKTPDKSTTFQLSLELLPVDPRTGDPSSWSQLKTLFPEDVVFPRRAEVSISRNNDTLNMSWKTDIETASSAELTASGLDLLAVRRSILRLSACEKFRSHAST
jgi:hypothetical protein